MEAGLSREAILMVGETASLGWVTFKQGVITHVPLRFGGKSEGGRAEAVYHAHSILSPNHHLVSPVVVYIVCISLFHAFSRPPFILVTPVTAILKVASVTSGFTPPPNLNSHWTSPLVLWPNTL